MDKTNFDLLKDFLNIIVPENNDNNGSLAVKKLRQWFVEKPERVLQLMFIIDTMELLIASVGEIAVKDVKEIEKNESTN